MQTTSVNSAPASRYEPPPGSTLLASSDTPPSDVLGQLLYSLEQLGQRSLDLAQTRVDATREELRESLAELVETMTEMGEKAREARKDGGFFSDLVDGVAKFVGKVVGTYTDAVLPVDNVVTLVEGLSSGENVLAALEAAALETVQTGDTADSVGGFTEGLVKFSADLAAFQARLQTALARAAATGEDPAELVASDSKALLASLNDNILENPEFWKVVGAAAKGAAVASACATGGAAAIAAVALFAALELDQKTGFIEKAAGKDAAKYVRLGLTLAAAACTAAAALGAGGASAGATLDIAEAGLHGATTLRSGYVALLEAAREADALDDSAEALDALNQVQQLQRLADRLLEALGEDQQDHVTTRELGTELVQTATMTERALIVPA